MGRTKRLKNSFYLKAIRLLNSHHQPASTQLCNPAPQRLLPYIHRLGINGHFNNGTLVTIIMFIYCITHLTCILFYCILVNATPTWLDLLFMYFLIPFFYSQICVYCCELLDTTALLALGTQVSRLSPKSVPLLVRAVFGGRRYRPSSHH